MEWDTVIGLEVHVQLKQNLSYFLAHLQLLVLPLIHKPALLMQDFLESCLY